MWGVDQPRRDDLARPLQPLVRIRPCAAGMDAGNQRADNADIRGSQSAGHRVKQRRILDQQIESRVTTSRGNGADREDRAHRDRRVLVLSCGSPLQGVERHGPYLVCVCFRAY